MRPKPLPLLGGLYGVQGIVAGFTAGILVPLLASRGASIEDQVGLVALTGVPWVLKLPVAVALDRLRPGASRVAGAAMLSMGVLVLAFSGLGAGGGDLPWLGPVWLLLNFMLAAQDVSADAVALDAVEPDARGRANGVMQGALVLGSTLAGAYGLGAVVVRWGLQTALVVLALILLCAGVWAVCSTLSTRVAPSHAGLVSVLRKPSTWAIGTLVSVFYVADTLTSALSGAFFIHRLEWSLEDVQTILPWPVLASQVLGFVVAAVSVDRIGHVRATTLGCAVLGGTTLGFAVAPAVWPSVGFIIGFTVVQGVAMGVMVVGLHAWLMGLVEPSVRATHYAVFASLLNLPRAWVPGFAPGLLERLGWGGVFGTSGAIQLAVAGLFFFAARRFAGGEADGGDGRSNDRPEPTQNSE